MGRTASYCYALGRVFLSVNRIIFPLGKENYSIHLGAGHISSRYWAGGPLGTGPGAWVSGVIHKGPGV